MRRPSTQGGRFNDPLLSTGTTPLLRALINNDTALARLLLEKGANPNIFGTGLSPWLYAAGIRGGTYNSNPARGGGSGGVGAGSVNVDMALLDVMLARGADVNARVTGAASYSGRLARALTGDPVNTTSNEGMTALHVAVRSRNASLVRYLLDKNARNGQQGRVGPDAGRRARWRAGLSACCVRQPRWRRAAQSECRCGAGGSSRRPRCRRPCSGRGDSGPAAGSALRRSQRESDAAPMRGDPIHQDYEFFRTNYSRPTAFSRDVT